MKKYSVDGYSILDNMPHSFQISDKNNSYRLVQYPLKGEYPYPIKIQKSSLNENHALLYTPGIFMELSWIDDEYEPNGQITLGIRTPRASLDFAHWTTLINNVPKRVINLAIYVLMKSPVIEQYEVPLFPSDTNNNNSSSNNNNSPPTPPPPPPPPEKPKRKLKVSRTVKNTQRRFRNV